MYKTLHRNIRQQIEKKSPETGSAFPSYLEEEYKNEYQFKCSRADFYSVVRSEILECKIDSANKNPKFVVYFGKYKGRLIHELEDIDYLVWCCRMFRKTKQPLVSQALLRLKELGYMDLI